MLVAIENRIGIDNQVHRRGGDLGPEDEKPSQIHDRRDLAAMDLQAEGRPRRIRHRPVCLRLAMTRILDRTVVEGGRIVGSYPKQMEDIGGRVLVDIMITSRDLQSRSLVKPAQVS